MLELFADTSSTLQSLLDALLSFSSDQLSVLSLIKSLNLAGLLEYFAFISLTFQSLLIVEVPITIFMAQLHPRSALCFISLIKSLNLAGLLPLLQYLAVTSSTFQLLLIINTTT